MHTVCLAFDARRVSFPVLLCVCGFRFGFDVAHYREMSPRKEGGSPVQGQLIALVKRGAEEQQEESQKEPDDVAEEL